MSTLKLSIILVAFALSFGIHKQAKKSTSDSLFGVKPKVEKTTNTEAETSSSNSSNKIQVALLLDTSSSMSGLIEQTKSQLWKILNKLAATKKDDEDPELEIALYEYGNPMKSNDENQIHQLASFTTDMDMISEKLFSLTTSGGEEYCGSVISSSLNDLEWSNNPDNLKLIYIAGNESFAQGPIDFRQASTTALEKNVSINTIFCGDHQTGININWAEGADAGNGTYMSINQNEKTVHIETPYDDKINTLNKDLNKTYIPFGREGNSKIANQKKQDKNAEFYGKSNNASRAIFKSSKKYKAESWDLVDAYEKDKKIINSAKALPDSLSNLSINELEAKIALVKMKRENIQNQIQELAKKRSIYIQEQQEENEESSNLEKSILKSIKKQAGSKGFKLNN